MAAATAQGAGHLVVPESMAQSCAPEEILPALTPENCRLVALIHRYRPQSITELCRLAARPQPNVSRSLAALERAGIVSMAGSRPKRPELVVQRVTIDLAELQNGRCEVDDSWRQIARPSSLLRDG
ncbi:helix-turn-helix domain-containing protein [Mesorhizobium sp. M0904]|uniref:HVO_A0114 family putative DNA-binding protein n=1 Tax=Mesorhizobium sp. M0904 TaxID=2957022 RepID=UPI00333BD694